MGRASVGCLGDRPDMGRSGAAASADDIQPAMVDKFGEMMRE